MRWPSVGTRVVRHFEVTPADRAHFEDEDIHDVFGTAAMVRAVEHVSRWLFKQSLEEGEEGAGASISLRHLGPVPVGAVVDIVATVAHAEGRRMVTTTEILLEGSVMATAEFTQVLLDPERWSPDGRNHVR